MIFVVHTRGAMYAHVVFVFVEGLLSTKDGGVYMLNIVL